MQRGEGSLNPWVKKEFHVASTIKLASSGISLIFEIDKKVYCVSIKQLEEVIAGHRQHATIHEIVDVKDPAEPLIVLGNP